MILGQHCRHKFPRPLELTDVDEAVRRLREDFLFFGLTDHFEESARLALKMLAPHVAFNPTELVDEPFSDRARSKVHQVL